MTLFADSPEGYQAIKAAVSADVVKEHYRPFVHGTVTRYEVPKLWALKFVMTGALGGGAPSSLRSDNLGKTMGAFLLRMWVDVPDEIADNPTRFAAPN